AAAWLDGLLIYPGETFSFWRTVGRVSGERGYLAGMTIVGGRPESDIGGGLCQLANLVHWLVLNSPLTVTELHHHSDAIFPDSGRRVPFGTGTSVFYKNVDYRFRNDTDRTVQLRVWLEQDDLCGELLSESAFPCRYRIEEEGHCFVREGGDYYRLSRVYKCTIDRKSGETLLRELILNNHSRVLYDHRLIPAGEIKDGEDADAD
ncbi:MAG: VanW family protein, partial [Acetanaerobacterium sp.]